MVMGVILLSSIISYGQSVTFPFADSVKAVVNRPYYYQVRANASPNDATYSLDVGLDGMTITPGGLIKWTPDSISDGGRVIVRATNSEDETGTHEFFINVAEDVVIPQSAVAYWNLDENLDDVNDSVFSDWLGHHDARVTQTKPVDTAGITGLAQKILLNENSEIIVEDASDFNWTADQSFSIEFWFKMYPGDIDKTRVIIGRNQGGNETDPHWWIGLDLNDELYFTIREESLTTAEVKTSNYFNNFNWHHVVAVRNAVTGKISLFVDGGTDLDHQPDSVDYDYSGPGLVTDAPLCIGWLKPVPSGSDEFHYPGKIDEVIIHDKALSPAEILERFNNSKKGPGNFAPLFTSIPEDTTDEESFYSYHYEAADLDDDPLVFDTVAGKRPSWLNWNKAGGILSGTPSDNDVGTFDVSIKVNDGHVDIYQNFKITVNNVNDRPVLSEIETVDLAYKEEDGKVNLTSTIQVSDVDNTNIDSARIWISANYDNSEDVLEFTNTAEISGVWNTTSGVLKLTGTTTKADYQAALRSVTYENTNTVAPVTLTRTVNFTINDGELNSTPVTRNITVESLNDCPVISGHASLSTPEEDTILIRLDDLTFSDVDDGPGSFSILVAGGDNYTFNGNIVTPATDFNGMLNVNVMLSDSECSVDYVLPVSVKPVNDPPQFNFEKIVTDAYENQTYLSVIKASDSDPGDTIIYSVVQKPDWLFLVQDTILSGIPEFADVGNNTVTLRISDTIADTDTTFIINVHSTNYIPHITSVPPLSVDEDELYTYYISVLDTNSKDILFLTAPVLPDWLTLNADQKILEGTPGNEQVGVNTSAEFTVQLKVSDGKQDSTQTFIITVHNVPDPPVIIGQADTIVSYPDSSVIITLSDLVVEDVDNLISDLSLIILPGEGYSLNENSLTVKIGEAGLLKVVVRVEDPDKLKDQDTIVVRVVIPSAIESNLADNNQSVKVYPVPANNRINFKISCSDASRLELLDITGKCVLARELSKGEEKVTIDTQELPEGLYFYRISGISYHHSGIVTIRK